MLWFELVNEREERWMVVMLFDKDEMYRHHSSVGIVFANRSSRLSICCAALAIAVILIAAAVSVQAVHLAQRQRG